MFTSEVQSLGIKEIRAVIASIRNGYGDDFTDFNLGVLSRRVAMAMNRLSMRDLDVLCQTLERGDRIFYKRLLAELTPPTTELLRDPSFWLHLREEIIPQLLPQNDRLRILQAAYGTGEELYSLLITLEELKLRARVEIWCSYLSEDTLVQVKNCAMPLRRREIDEANFERIQAANSYSHYVTETPEAMIFNPDWLNDVHFFRLAPEYKLGADPKFHLILCRNQFLYFNLQLGMRNMQVLFDKLLTRGVLVLGTKESLDSYQNGSTFTVLNQEESIYRKRE